MREWLGQPNLHPEEDLFLAYDGANPIGYLQNCLEPPQKRVVMEGGLHPQHHCTGADSRLVERSLALASQRGYRVAHIPTPFAALDTRRMARGLGFRLVRRYWEMRHTDPASVPPPRTLKGLTFRSFADGDEKALMEAQNLSFSKHWGFSLNTLEEVTYKAHMSMFCPEGILLFMDGDKAVGFNWTRLETSARGLTGYICMMGTHPEYRGLGLGQTVMRAGVAHLRSAGAARVDLTVDSNNASALKIYRAGGFRRRAVTLWYERRL